MDRESFYAFNEHKRGRSPLDRHVGLPRQSRDSTIAIPAGTQIRRITVSRANIPGLEDEIGPPRAPVIEDRARIARIAEFLAAHNRGWYHPWDTYPIHWYKIVLECDQGSSFYLSHGGDEIGGGSEQLRRMGQQEAREFRDLLGIPQAP